MSRLLSQVAGALCVAVVLAGSGAAAQAKVASRSLGLPWDGRLVGGVQLPAAGDHFFTWDFVLERSPNRGWRRFGNERLVQTLLRVLRAYAAAHPTAPRVGIGDLSRPHGGAFGPRFGPPGHASHQNGLDVDVFYPRRDRREWPPARPRQIDRPLAQDLVDRFVAAGAAKVFVGPHTGLKGPPAIVEELPAYHDNHMHVRLPGDGVRPVLAGSTTLGRPIRAFVLGRGRVRVLIVGCIRGDECPGSVVATRLLHATPPKRGSIWVVQEARGAGLKVAVRLIRRLHPDVTIWFDQARPLVRANGASVVVARRYARLAGMRFRPLPQKSGSAGAWQQPTLPGTRSFVVDLPPGALGLRGAGRYARAVLELAG